MGYKTSIEWTNRTWNPWVGCHPVSEGCKRCYMFRDMRRYGQTPDVVRRTKDPTFYSPLKWEDPSFIFTCSWSDFFIEEADAWRDEAWEIIHRTPQHTYQILTKRPERIVECLPDNWLDETDISSHVWLGVTAENQRMLDIRWPHLESAGWWFGVPVLFLSLEPLLGPIDLTECFEEHFRWTRAPDWVIVGGESGPGARPMKVEWVRDIRDQCVAAEVPFFFKQYGGASKKRGGDEALLDGRLWHQMPAGFGRGSS
jgi:protein gp37